MTRKQAIRLSIDGSMFVLLLWVMAHTLTGNTLHEWSGIALTALFVAHFVLNATWIKRLFKGRYNFRRTFGTVVNILMLAAVLTLIAASLPISSEVFPWFHLFADEMLPAQIHILAGNWLFVLAALHLGTQWHRVQPFLPKYSQSMALILRIVLVSVAAYGVWALWQRNLPAKLAMYYTFDFGRADETLLRFAADYLSIFVLFAVIAYYLLAAVIGRRKKGLNRPTKTDLK